MLEDKSSALLLFAPTLEFHLQFRISRPVKLLKLGDLLILTGLTLGNSLAALLLSRVKIYENRNLSLKEACLVVIFFFFLSFSSLLQRNRLRRGVGNDSQSAIVYLAKSGDFNSRFLGALIRLPSETSY